MNSNDEVHSADEQLLDQAILEYLRAEAAGKAGNRQQWLDRYPACAESLSAFFDDRESVKRAVLPVRLDRQMSAGARDSTEFFSPAAADLVPAECDSVNICSRLPHRSSDRYRPLTFHARGGMGEIWLAKDERIGRQVAVKKLRSGREMQQARFFIEAQITGQLEHPSVVPLHDMGLDDAGNPFYVMKFIHGRRLKDAIADYHARKSQTDWPNDLEFRRLLETFLSVCNVVAFAHDKGVLHRDIKPDNVMIGPYGETVLVDWGLAKVVGQADVECASGIRLSDSGSSATQNGAIIGSPLYMSPECAKGQPEAIDQSSDVYLLGATLYELLCNRPPRQGDSSWALIDLTLHSRPINPRSIDRQIPRPLEAICMKAMAFEKRDRYESPLALAKDVERYLAAAPTLAYREPLLTRVGRWMRRHRRSILQGFSGLLVAGLVFFSIHTYRQARLLAEREMAREQLTSFHRLADEAHFFAANTDAITERVPYYDPRHAQQSGEMAMAIAAPWGVTAEHFPLVDGRKELLQSQYTLLLLMAQSSLQNSRSESAARQALALLDRASAVQSPSRGYYSLRNKCFLLLGDAHSAEAEEHRANEPNVPVMPQDYFLAGELLRLQDVGASAQALGEDESSVGRDHLEAAVQQYRRALDADPRHYWARFQLGRCLLALGRDPEAIATLSACIAMRPSSPWAYATRGLANAKSGRPDEALNDLNRAVRLDPTFQPARLDRAVFHWSRKNYDDALADFGAVLATSGDKRLIEAAFYRGQIFVDLHRDKEALDDFSSVIAARPDFRPAYWVRAKTHIRLEDFDAGLSDIKTFLAFDPDQRQLNTADQHFILGKALRKIAQELVDNARTAPLRAAANELQAAIDVGPPTADMWRELGAVQELLGRDGDAVSAYSQGLAIASANVRLRNSRGWTYVKSANYDLAQADFAEALRARSNDANAHTGLGFVLAALGRDNAAYREASAALLAGADEQLIVHNVACIYGQLSAAPSETKTDFENLAIAAFQRAISLSLHNPLGPDADELKLIRNEQSLPNSLKARPEFQRLLAGEQAVP